MTCRIAVVDDEPAARKRLTEAFTRDGHDVEGFPDAESFLTRAARAPFDAALIDLMLPGMDGMAALKALKTKGPATQTILITGYGSVELATQAIKLGAFHYVTKPVRLADVRNLVREACEKAAMLRENLLLRRALREETGLASMIGASASMRQVFDIIRKIAPVGCNVLLQGASGTGKALAAKALHQLSPRNGRAFVSFNCGGFTEELIASELFGHEKGAFTGAAATRVGLLESASGGTLFLDEIGEMPLSMQVKLLHVIQERRILRVGGTQPIDLDIRIIAATNRDLKEEAAAGLFREDLFYRLNVVTIHLPRLTDRREDIPLFVRHFVDKYALLFHKDVRRVSPEFRETLLTYDFPGNVRELENIIERAVALCEGDTLSAADLPQDLRQVEFDSVEGEGLATLDDVERRHIAKVLARTDRNKGLTAQILGIPRTTLWRKMKRYKLD